MLSLSNLFYFEGIVNYNFLIYWILGKLSLLINLKEGVEVWGNSLYEKLWIYLDKREKRDFGSINFFNALLFNAFQLISFKKVALQSNETTVSNLGCHKRDQTVQKFLFFLLRSAHQTKLYTIYYSFLKNNLVFKYIFCL